MRLADGKNVTGSFTSVSDLAAVHAWVATQESAVTFTLVVPGPPSVLFPSSSLLLFLTLVTGPRRSLSLRLSDKRVYEASVLFPS